MIARLVQLTGLSTPLLLGIALRFWSVFAGLVSIHFVTRGLSATVQGYYYTFGSLTQLTTLVDLGLQTVVLQFASHEAAHLVFGKGGRVSGLPRAMARLSSIGQFSLTWFGILSIVTVGGLLAAGYWMFPAHANGVSWQAPWLMLCVLAAVDLWSNNFFWLLEGTNQLIVIYVYRFGRGVITSLALWASLSAGYGLYAIPFSLAAAIVFLFVVLAVSRWQFVLFFFEKRPHAENISWRREILPLQLRLGISTISGFVQYSLFVPITFRLLGPVAAGQMGLSWTLVDSMTGVAILWPAVKFPTMGALVALRDWASLDRLTLRIGIQATVLVLLGAVTLIVLRKGLDVYGLHLAGRLLPFFAFSILASASLPKLLSSVMIFYLRAHQKEPIVVLTSIVTPVMLGSMVAGALLGGTAGITIGYTCVMTFLMLPGTTWILIRCRAAWHGGSVATTAPA